MAQAVGSPITANFSFLLEEGGLVDVVASAAPPIAAPFQIQARAGGNASLARLGGGDVQTVIPAGAVTFWTARKLQGERLVTMNGNSIEVNSV